MEWWTPDAGRGGTASGGNASAAEVSHVVALYKSGFGGWNLSHFHSTYKVEFKGQRSYSWLKSVLQGAGVVKPHKRRGEHRINASGRRCRA